MYLNIGIPNNHHFPFGTNGKVVVLGVPILKHFTVIPISPFQNNPKDLDPSFKMDLDLWDCFGRKKLHLIIEEIRLLKMVSGDPANKDNSRTRTCACSRP